MGVSSAPAAAVQNSGNNLKSTKRKFRYLINLALIIAIVLAVCDLLVDFGSGVSLWRIVLNGIGFAALIFGGRIFFLSWFNQNLQDPQPVMPARLNAAGAVLFGLALGSMLADNLSATLTNGADTFAYLESALIDSNLHEIDPGQFYRAGQMSNPELIDTVKRLGIKSVIDLRFGDDEPPPNVPTEEETTKALGGAYYHLRSKSSELPQLEEVQKLIDVYDTAERPLLVHCSSGTHRSGFASAVWVLTQDQDAREKALDQFSPRFGFFKSERRIKQMMAGKDTPEKIIYNYVKDAAADMPFREWIKKYLSEIKR